MKPYIFVFFLAILFSSCQEEKIVFVADHFGDCGENCLLLKENENDDWVPFKDKIEGFVYESGYEYKLKVKIENNKTESGLKYTLLEVISKTKKNQIAKLKIDNVEWFVSQIEGFKNKTDKSPSFTIKNGNIQGNSGCNGFGGSFQTDQNGMFKTGMLRMTKMYCESYMDLENAFTGALRRATRYKIDQNILKVMDNDGKTVLTASKKKMEKKSIENKWFVHTIKGFNNNTNKTPYFTIKSGQISGANGCNSFGGKLSTDKSGLFKTGMLNVTERYCEKLRHLENAFHEALKNATSYKISDGTLYLLDKSKYILLSATKDEKIIEEMNTNHKPYIIEYNTYSRNLAIRNKIIEEKNVLYYHDLRPKLIKEQKVMLSKSELLFFKNKLSGLDLKELENIVPPSTKYLHDAAAGATLIVSLNGKTYRVPKFDHGNPPIEIKSIVEKIMALRSK